MNMLEFLQDEDGYSFVEFALLLALVALMAYAVVCSLGDKVLMFYTDARDKLGTVLND